MDVNNLDNMKITNLLIVLNDNIKPNKGDILTIQVNGGVEIEVTNVSLEYAKIDEIKTAVIEYAKYSGYLHYLSMLLNQLNLIFKNIEAGKIDSSSGHVTDITFTLPDSSKINVELNTEFKESFAQQGDDYTVGKCFLRVPIGYDEIFKNNLTIIKPELETKINNDTRNTSKYLMKPMLDLIVSGTLKPKYLPEAELRISPPLFDYDESNTTNELSQVLKGGGYKKSRKNIKKVIHKKLKTKYSRK